MNYSDMNIFLLLCLLNAVHAEIILRVDPLALLSATLRTYQKAACDTDQVVIACPRGTSISIEFAQYNKFIAKDGISIDELCPADQGITQIQSKAKHLLRGSTFGSPGQKVPANRYANGGYSHVPVAAISSRTTNAGVTATSIDISNSDDNAPDNCMWPNALQYSLLQTVVEACQKKKHCKFNGSPNYYGLGASGVGDSSGTSSYHSSTVSAISVDPCPKRRKIVEVAYKCRPYEFRSKVACHNDVAQLECNPYSRIAVYSASFGRTEYESIQCPQPQGVREETCLASYATETVMQICHGRRRCNLAADANTFGSPCQPNSRMYLKVVYTCVPKQVLKDRYESEVENDETEDFDGDNSEVYDDELSYKESEAIPKMYGNATITSSRSNAANTSVTNGGAASENNIGNNTYSFDGAESDSVNPVMTHSADLSLEDNQERLYLYLLIAGSIGVIVCIIIVAVRVMLQKREEASSETQMSSSIKGAIVGRAGGDTSIPNGFNDTISEIDADIDLTTPIPVPSVSKNENYIAYGPSSSLYGSLGPSNISHTSSTLLLQGNAAVGIADGPSSADAAATLLTNPVLCGVKQSPDIIGISTSTFLPTSAVSSGGVTSMRNILTPTIVIGSGAAVVSSSAINYGSSAIGTVVPITSLAQYTTAPTFRTSGYIINTEAMLQRPTNTPTPPITVSNTGGSFNAPSQSGTSSSSHQLAAALTLRRMKSTVSAAPPALHQQPSYDGTAPRTLSTGIPITSQFYYG